MTDRWDQLAALEQAATPGPWIESGRDVDHDRYVAEGKNPGDSAGLGCEIDGPPGPWLRGQFHNHADAALIAEMRNALPDLLRERAELRAALRRYGWHDSYCAASSDLTDDARPCTCGLRAALAGDRTPAP